MTTVLSSKDEPLLPSTDRRVHPNGLCVAVVVSCMFFLVGICAAFNQVWIVVGFCLLFGGVVLTLSYDDREVLDLLVETVDTSSVGKSECQVCVFLK